MQSRPVEARIELKVMMQLRIEMSLANWPPGSFRVAGFRSRPIPVVRDSESKLEELCPKSRKSRFSRLAG